MLDDDGHMEPTDVDRDLDVDIAVRWGDGYDTRVQSYVNIIATPKGGTHVAGFERALTKTFSGALQNTRLLKAGEEVVKDDVLEGMTAVVTVRLAEPQFEGQTKEVLGTPAVSRLVAKAVERELTGVPHLDQGGDRRPGPRRAGEGGRGVPGPGRRPAAPGGAAAQERARVVVPADQAGRLPQHRRRPLRAVHRRGRLRPGHGQAGPRLGVPGAAADPRQDPQRAEGLGRRHAEERRVRLDHPGGRRRLRAAPSTSTRPATARSSSWPTPTPTAPTSAACWPRCSSATCGRWSTPAGSSPPCRRCTGSS